MANPASQAGQTPLSQSAPFSYVQEPSTQPIAKVVQRTFSQTQSFDPYSSSSFSLRPRTSLEEEAEHTQTGQMPSVSKSRTKKKTMAVTQPMQQEISENLLAIFFEKSGIIDKKTIEKIEGNRKKYCQDPVMQFIKAAQKLEHAFHQVEKRTNKLTKKRDVSPKQIAQTLSPLLTEKGIQLVKKNLPQATQAKAIEPIAPRSYESSSSEEEAATPTTTSSKKEKEKKRIGKKLKSRKKSESSESSSSSGKSGSEKSSSEKSSSEKSSSEKSGSEKSDSEKSDSESSSS